MISGCAIRKPSHPCTDTGVCRQTHRELRREKAKVSQYVHGTRWDQSSHHNKTVG
ncbi:hypothetical protein FH972_022579 [Carpinus fangiana]|uniref:Uncharacterized protein n=1 Tax=Carpinus fangiana TaxID=176857 RepID=A0A5N6KT69_9ROSI|nr:hypothetical protein FH972_022579 [Carpinus fangiana]